MMLALEVVIRTVLANGRLLTRKDLDKLLQDSKT